MGGLTESSAGSSAIVAGIGRGDNRARQAMTTRVVAPSVETLAVRPDASA
jgi:hypothetical protein